CRDIQRIVVAHQALLGRLLQLLDRPFAAQGVALARATFDVHQRHRRAGMEEASATPAPMGGEATLGIVADAAIQGTVGGANQVDEPGFGRIGIHAAATAAGGSEAPILAVGASFAKGYGSSATACSAAPVRPACRRCASKVDRTCPDMVAVRLCVYCADVCSNPVPQALHLLVAGDRNLPDA